MSDGPHRSLPMRPGWKRVAERAGNTAYPTDEIAAALVPALAQDCRQDVNSELLNAILSLCREQDTSLFKNDLGPQLQALREKAGSGMERTLLSNVAQISPDEKYKVDALVAAFAATLKDRVARGARQVEEHLLRKTATPRAQDTRARIETASGNAPYADIAREFLKIKTAERTRPALKKQDLDDGVPL